MRTPGDLQVAFDRVTYRDGQVLASRDLQDDVRANQRLRGLHTRYLHGTWGIALGFEVTGGVSDTAVRVGPGYAIDEQGRELVLAQTFAVPVPESSPASGVQTIFVLVMTYQTDAGLMPRPEVDAVCLGSDMKPRNERPVLTWRTPDDVRFGPEVPLATVLVNNGALLASPGLQVRRYAARHIRPHVGFGTLTPGFTEIGGAVAADVDTSEAGFTTTPAYQVTLHFDPDTPFGQALLALLPFAFIEAAEPTRFRYVIPIRRQISGIRMDAPLAVSRPRQPVIKLSWVGLEPVSGCEPRVNPLFLFTLAGLRLHTTVSAVAVVPGTL